MYGLDDQFDFITVFNIQVIDGFRCQDGCHLMWIGDIKLYQRHDVPIFDTADFCTDFVAGAVFHDDLFCEFV